MKSIPSFNMEPSTLGLALVTGGAHRLGRVFSLALARMGYDIIVHYNKSVELAKGTALDIEILGRNAILMKADLSQESEISALFERIDTLAVPLKVLVNSAAVMRHEDARTLSAGEFDLSMSLNLRAPFLCAQNAFKRMPSGGAIINISDSGAQKAWTGFPAYIVSKAALESLTRVLARSFAPTVRVNAIAPGLALPADGFPPEEWQKLVARLPLQRQPQMDEIASALEFLLKNEYITGQVIPVDGGYNLL